ncbi:hypothetical protein RTG_01886 [Rhodotorula toruloides ATCC 204091]|nr:hypothetical protein RTG_01886 [Rhodotorula toruloides ATCC 204091]
MDKLISYLPPGLPLLIDVLNLRQPLNAALLALLVVLTLRVLLPAPPFVPPPYALSDSPASGDYHWRPATHPKSEVWRKWTTKELRGFDGTNPAKEGGRILFAIRRKVYDVSSGRNFYGPGGPYAIFAGRDASRGLAKQSFEADMLTPVDEPIDSLDDLTSSEWDNLKDWERESCLFASSYQLSAVDKQADVDLFLVALLPFPRLPCRAPLFFLACDVQNTSRPNTSFAGAFVKSARLHVAQTDTSPSTLANRLCLLPPRHSCITFASSPHRPATDCSATCSPSVPVSPRQSRDAYAWSEEGVSALDLRLREDPHTLQIVRIAFTRRRSSSNAIQLHQPNTPPHLNSPQQAARMGLLPSVDPSLVPPFLLVSLPLAYLSYRFYVRLTTIPPSQRPYDPKTGIGRGAPGFQTGVRKVAIPKDLMERIKRGEEVSAEEITAGIERERERLEREERSSGSAGEEEAEQRKLPENVDEEWLPAGATGSSGKNKTRRRKK